MYPKDTEKWKQFTTLYYIAQFVRLLLCIPKILKNESNSQRFALSDSLPVCCCVSQRYWKMKAIHNSSMNNGEVEGVVVYPKDTEKWKQFTTIFIGGFSVFLLLCIPKILKNESNSQRICKWRARNRCCCVSQRYWKMKAIHNKRYGKCFLQSVVVYPKDTEKWKQFTTQSAQNKKNSVLLCIPKILKNESNSQQESKHHSFQLCCCVSQRYWKMKAIHNVAKK